MINSVTIAGHIGKEPEFKTFSNGNYKVVFYVALNKVKNEVESVIWIRGEAWGKTADFINNYLHSGSFIIVQGRLDYSSWEDELGKKKSILFVVAEKVESPKSISK